MYTSSQLILGRSRFLPFSVLSQITAVAMLLASLISAPSVYGDDVSIQSTHLNIAGSWYGSIIVQNPLPYFEERIFDISSSVAPLSVSELHSTLPPGTTPQQFFFYPFAIGTLSAFDMSLNTGAGLGGSSTINAHATSVFTAAGILTLDLSSFLRPDTYAGGYELQVLLTDLTLSSTLFDLHRVKKAPDTDSDWLYQNLTFETDSSHLYGFDIWGSVYVPSGDHSNNVSVHAELSVTPSARVPEIPSTLGLLSVPLIALGLIRRER